MIVVSPEFTAAQFADVAQYQAQVFLILGNYAASAAGSVAASSGAAANYPASGAIDSDRTEINIGPASGADNGVGLSSFKSSVVPDGTGNVWLTVTFAESTTFNRVKLYNLAADPLTSYVIQYWDGAAWVNFAGTPDVFPPPVGPTAYNEGGFGFGPYGGIPYYPGGGYTGGLDVYDVADVTTTEIRVVVYSTTSGGAAQIVELEVYRAIDVTDRTTGFEIDRRKDLKQANLLAAQADVDFDNSDQFFSKAYVPTAAQVADGYVNSELALLGFDVEINEGFVTSNGVELIRTFTGSVDSLTSTSKSGTAKLQARDYTKHIIDQTDSCNLKTSVDIADAVKYLLNRNNVSNYTMNLFTTNITLNYFLTYETPILTSIQELVQAAGDALYFYDENGYANLQYYLVSTPQAHTDSSFTTSGWTAFAPSTPNTAGIINGQLVLYTAMSSGNRAAMYAASTQATGEWTQTYNFTFNNFSFVFAFMADNLQMGTGSSQSSPHNGYSIDVGKTSISLIRYDNYVQHTVATSAAITAPTSGQIRIERDGSGVTKVYLNGTLLINATDNTYTTSTAMSLLCGGNSSFPNTLYLYNMFLSTSLTTASGLASNPQVYSDTIDQGATVSTEGTLTADYTGATGATVTFYVATSADGITWDPWIAVASGSSIPSTTRRYIAWYMDVTGTNTNSVSLRSVGLTWFTGTGSQQKWSPSVNFDLTYDNSIQDVDDEISDNLGGDTAIINDVAVTSAPLILGGASTDTVWQATTGTPPAAVSVANPLNVNPGTLVYNITISGGMDTSGMAGGSCISMTLGTATATAAITYVHPTKPVLTITVTVAGTITNLKLIGKTFQNAQTPYQATATDATSIARHHKRHIDINNNYIVSSAVAQLIATKYVTNFKDPVDWIPRLAIFPPILNMQPSDQASVTEVLSAISANYYALGYTRTVSMSENDASAEMNVSLFKVPS